MFLGDKGKGVKGFMVSWGNMGGVKNYKNGRWFEGVGRRYWEGEMGRKEWVGIWEKEVGWRMVEVMWN